MYKIVDDNFVLRNDGACIPRNPDNADYQAFIEWEKAGGVVLPKDPEKENPKALLAELDRKMARAGEDILTVLVKKKLMSIADLPPAIQAIISERQRLRALLPPGEDPTL